MLIETIWNQIGDKPLNTGTLKTQSVDLHHHVFARPAGSHQAFPATDLGCQNFDWIEAAKIKTTSSESQMPG